MLGGRRSVPAWLALLFVLLATCARGAGSGEGGPRGGPTPTPATGERGGDGEASCSAAGLSEEVPEPVGLPAAVAKMRKEILKAAVNCDFELLERLALRGDGTFQYSFGQSSPEGVGDFWREREREGEEDLAILVKLLSLPYATNTIQPSPGVPPNTIYVWPALAEKQAPDEEDWRALRAVYPAEQVERIRSDFEALGTGYLAHRTGISQDGDWIFFVAGD